MQKFYSTPFHLRKKKEGFSVVEILLGISILSVVLFFSVDAVHRFTQSGRVQMERVQALYKTQETLEAVRFIRDSNWATFAALSSDSTLYVYWEAGGPTVTTTAQVVDGFTTAFQSAEVRRHATTEDIVLSGGVIDTDTKFVTATTTWSSGSLSLSTYLTEISP